MGFDCVFERYELKYMITFDQKQMIEKMLSGFMIPDSYGKSTIRNIYYDTPDFRLVRTSNEKPVYKEKLRVRSYKKVDTSEERVFVELKKKYDSKVYKRRVSIPFEQTNKWLLEGEKPKDLTQIFSEIEYFRCFYRDLTPKIFLSYNRESFVSLHEKDLRVTFDSNVLARRDDLSLMADVRGDKIVDDKYVLMEIKTHSSIPLWLAEILSKSNIYKKSFSKYGTAYNLLIYGNGGKNNVF